MTDPQKREVSWWVGLNRESFEKTRKEQEASIRASRFGQAETKLHGNTPGRPPSTRLKVSV